MVARRDYGAHLMDVCPWTYVLPEPPNVAVGYRNRTSVTIRLRCAERYPLRKYTKS